ncbi:hypothetical protein [Micromonospora sp. NPDC049645]
MAGQQRRYRYAEPPENAALRGGDFAGALGAVQEGRGYGFSET